MLATVVCLRVEAQPTLLTDGVPKAQPAHVYSGVATSDGKTFWNYDYAKHLAQFPGRNVDVFMQQCFSGGYASSLQSTLRSDNVNKGYTLTTSANWNEFTYVDVARDNAMKVVDVDNFTRSWLQSAPRDVGYYEHWSDATNGRAANPVVTAAPYARGGAKRTAKVFENPVFASPDALGAQNLVSPAGENNSRKIGGANQYAVLAAWGPKAGDNAEMVDINRVYQSLRGLGVPANNIVVLYGTAAAGSMTDAFPALGLNSHKIDGPTSLDKWKDAAAGKLFTVNPPNADAQLFVYNTGHGAAFDLKADARLEPVNGTFGPSTKVKVGALNLPVNALPDIGNSSSADGTIRLQVSTTSPLSSPVPVLLDDQLVGELVPTLPDRLLDFSEHVQTSYAYDVTFLATYLPPLEEAGGFSVEFGGLDHPASQIVKAISFDNGGDVFGFAVLPIPEPSIVWLLSLGGAIANLQRRGRRRDKIL